jgi:hypothetical protein
MFLEASQPCERCGWTYCEGVADFAEELCDRPEAGYLVQIIPEIRETHDRRHYKADIAEERASDIRAAFASLANSYAKRELPEDDSTWEFICPPPCADLTITAILYFLQDSTETMPDLICDCLRLPTGSTYSEGVKKISERRSNRESSGVLLPVDIEFIRELEELDGRPPRQ